MSNQLRNVLDSMFSSKYLRDHYPIGACTLLELECRQEHQNSTSSSSNQGDDHLCQVSSKPGSRIQIRSLSKCLDDSLKAHNAKPSGLCLIRRAIYDQCFDELIRQSTINCLESGLLLYRIRNELQATQQSYRIAYESGVKFGMKKALCSELEVKNYKQKIFELESEVNRLTFQLSKISRLDELSDDNKNDLAERTKAFHDKEIAKRDHIIEQQRAIIKSLSQNIMSEMLSNQSRQ